MRVRHVAHVGLGFQPGLADAAKAGIRVSRTPYPAGQAGVKMSLTKMAEIIREGANDPHVKELAWKVLNDAGFNGRGASAGTSLQRFTALVAYVRKWMLYAPDSPGTETMLSAAAMLCIRPGVCVRMGDCDDCTDLLGAMTMAVGIPVRIIKQNYGSHAQEHVLIEALCEGSWVAADPSTDMPVGQKPRAVREDRVDPLDVKTPAGTTGPEFIAIGAAPGPATETLCFQHPGYLSPAFYNGRWWARVGDVWHYYDGKAWVPVKPAGVGIGFCDYDLIKSIRARLIAPWYALNGDVDACKEFPIDQRYAFKGDFDTFVNWYSGALPFNILCGDAERDEIQQGRDFESRLNNWRKILSQTTCQLSSPDLPPLTQDDPRSRDYKPPEGHNIADDVKSILTAVAITAAVGAGIYVSIPLLRGATESLASRIPRRKRA